DVVRRGAAEHAVHGDVRGVVTLGVTHPRGHHPVGRVVHVVGVDGVVRAPRFAGRVPLDGQTPVVLVVAQDAGDRPRLGWGHVRPLVGGLGEVGDHGALAVGNLEDAVRGAPVTTVCACR